jgi:small subunit ribosomal protein S9
MMAEEEKPETPEETPSAPEQTTEAAEQSHSAEPTAAAQAGPSAQEEGESVEEPTGEPTGQEGELAAAVEESPAQARRSEEEPEAVRGEEEAPRAKPSVPGAHLEVDIVPEGVDPLGRDEAYVDPYAIEEEEGEQEEKAEEEEEEFAAPIATAAIDLASGARYRATGKRKTAIARVTLRPGTGTYLVNGRTLEEHFPRVTLQRSIRQPLETVGYEERMDVVARLQGGGISAQAGALRHGVSRALLEADPNLRGELKRRGFLTRDSRAKERKKAGLKKARKRPQFSKR